MGQVDADTYSGISRQQRRAVWREIQKSRTVRERGMAEVRRIAPRTLDSLLKPTRVASVESAKIARNIQIGTELPPMALLACSVCHRPTRDCVCGLDWGL